MLVTLKVVLNSFFSGNYFIALCAAGMILATQVLNGLNPEFSTYLIFLSSSTFLLYNFHRYSFRIDFSNQASIFNSVCSMKAKPVERVLYFFALFSAVVYFFMLNSKIYIFLIPLIVLALAYSIPVLQMGKRKLKLREVYFIKTPLLAIVWGVSVTIIPLLEQNINIFTSFVTLQLTGTILFMLALCIPFELRDIETDKIRNIRTFPVIYGIRKSKITGVIVVLFEILIHHFMTSLNSNVLIMLDVSSLTALVWILKQNDMKKMYFYKLLVDGTMILRFLLIYIAVNLL